MRLTVRRFRFACLAAAAIAVVLLAAIVPAGADPGVDLEVVSHVDSPDPVTVSNPVHYSIVVTNGGVSASQTVYLSTYEQDFGNESGLPITSVSGAGWTCGFSEGWSCHHAGLAAGQTASAVNITAKAPSGATTIANLGSIYSADSEINYDNNSWEEDTDVITSSSCGETDLTCASGFLTYARTTSITSGAVPTLSRWLVGTATFTGVPGTPGGQVWSMVALRSPEQICPTNLLPLVKCTFQMNIDPIPAVYPVGNTTLVLVCHKSHCPKGLIPGVGLLLVEVGANGIGIPLLPCIDGLPLRCFTATRTAAGHLKMTIRNLSSGDPKIAGLCIRGC
jgi:Domain of unknown function DUF11